MISMKSCLFLTILLLAMTWKESVDAKPTPTFGEIELLGGLGGIEAYPLYGGGYGGGYGGYGGGYGKENLNKTA